MKNIKIYLAILFTSIIITSCNKEPDPTFDTKTPNPIIYDNVKKLNGFIAKNETKFQTFSIDASKGGVITSVNGTKFYIPAYAFADASNNPVTGNVDISIKEILGVSDMMLSNKPTITNDGQFLESFGEFMVKVEQNKQPLNLIRDSGQIDAAIRVVRELQKQQNTQFPLWDGDTSITYTQNGHNHENIQVTKTTQFLLNKGIDWKQKLGEIAWSTGDSLRFDLKDLFKWVNVDVISSLSNEKTTLLCYFTNHYNAETSADYQGVQASMCFFKPDGLNTVIKLYNTIIDAPAGKEGFLSYQNSMPVGVTGTFLALTIKDEKYYLEKRTETIAKSDAGKDYTTLSFNLKQVTEAELLTAMKSMNQ